MADQDRGTVLFNDRLLLRPRTGVGHYLGQLLHWLPRVRPDLCYQGFYFDVLRRGVRPPAHVRPKPGRSLSGPRLPWSARRILQEGYQTACNALAPRGGACAYHEPNHVPMEFWGPIVTTIHDLSVLRYPQWHPPDRVAWYEQGFARGLETSAHFIAASEFTRSEMVSLLGLDPERITVIYQAPREVFTPQPLERSQSVLERLRIDGDFLLFVGTREPRKNLGRLVRAYLGLPAVSRRRTKLVLAGGIGWGDVLPDASTPPDGVRLIGYVSDEELAALYGRTRALVWPSLYEGFGLPPLECMACGGAVMTANVASMPEIVGEAGILVDPHDPEAIADALGRLIDDDGLIEDLRDRGGRRVTRFSWEECARQHAAVYDRLLR